MLNAILFIRDVKNSKSKFIFMTVQNTLNIAKKHKDFICHANEVGLESWEKTQPNLNPLKIIEEITFKLKIHIETSYQSLAIHLNHHHASTTPTDVRNPAKI